MTSASIAPPQPSFASGLIFMLALTAASIGASFAGYSVAAAILHDGERAISGFLYGYLGFAVAAAASVLTFRRTYRRRIGSLLWFVLGAIIAPPLGLMLLGSVLSRLGQ